VSGLGLRAVASPLSDEGLKQAFVAARERAGLVGVTCHQLRHTCFTRLPEAGMELEALQAQVGHRSLDATRLYTHFANDLPAAWTLVDNRSQE
jgi:integrase